MNKAPEVIVEVERRAPDSDTPDDERISQCVRAAIAATAYAGPPLEVAVAVVDEDDMQRVNRDFREQDKPTNVLSFPAGEVDGLPETERRPLGDILVCASVVRDEAAAQGKAPGDHWAHMIVHGALHLLNFDHISDTDAEIMEQLEVRILDAIGVADPYQVS